MAAITGNSMYGVSIQLKYKNAADWGDSDVLLAGEIGLELDTKKAKLGDGSTPWKDLGYYTDPVAKGLIDSLTERVGSIETKDEQQDASIESLTSRMTSAEGVNTEQGTSIETLQTEMTGVKNVNETQQADIDALKGITVISANPAPAGN